MEFYVVEYPKNTRESWFINMYIYPKFKVKDWACINFPNFSFQEGEKKKID